MNITGISKLLLACDKKQHAGLIRKSLNSLRVNMESIPLDSVRTKLTAMLPDCLLLVVEETQELSDGWIENIKQYDDNLPIVVVSHSQNLEEVVRLMKQGIYDYFTVPFDPRKLQMALQNAFRMYQITKKLFLLENQLGSVKQLDDMIGSSPLMHTVFQTVKNVAPTNATVLITGESGTGKELVAKAIHHLSPRKDRRFIDINCGAIPRELLENELFGHERGAYTGADKRYIGCCERSDGGTLFLDEISEMDPALQVKLLRFLQERQFTRVGGTDSIHVDCRIVAATNRDLPALVAQNLFREDLFYRLNVVVISLPSLRERKEDIPLLAKFFLEKYSSKNDKIFLDFTPEALEALVLYSWPGNIRELENTIERAVVLHNDTKIKMAHLPQSVLKRNVGDAPTLSEESFDKGKVLPLTLVERYAIESALKICTGNVAMAARRLKIGQATLYRKIKQYGIRI